MIAALARGIGPLENQDGRNAFAARLLSQPVEPTLVSLKQSLVLLLG